ncbi:hypothetical protein [Aliarcobacter lanthieri]|uniref:hypothetical protein n=1 Tax=Aliarcobacter lanthieri TaxID=1355374 RepID=UPI003AB0E036
METFIFIGIGIFFIILFLAIFRSRPLSDEDIDLIIYLNILDNLDDSHKDL